MRGGLGCWALRVECFLPPTAGSENGAPGLGMMDDSLADGVEEPEQGGHGYHHQRAKKTGQKPHLFLMRRERALSCCHNLIHFHFSKFPGKL